MRVGYLFTSVVTKATTNIKHMSAGISGWKAAGMKTEAGG